MKNFLFFLILFFLNFHNSFTQSFLKTTSSLIQNLPENTLVVGLGDPTHQELTITQHRIEVIKQLVLNKEFKIIAIEGNIYEIYKAHQQVMIDNNFSHYEKAMYSQLNAKIMEELYSFIYEENKNNNSVFFVGFDPSFSGVSFVNYMEEDLKGIISLSQAEKNDFIVNLRKATNRSLSALFRNSKKVKKKIVHYATKIKENFTPSSRDDYFFDQALQNILYMYGDELDDEIMKHNKRDIGMALNLAFIRNQFPNEKIILFGSSTHLIKNPKAIFSPFYQNNRITFGQEIYKKLKDSYYFIGYTALSGTKFNAWNQRKPIELPVSVENSIEYKIEKEFNTNCYLTKSMSFPLHENTSSRFIGHTFLNLTFWEVMDALVLLKEVSPFEINKMQ